MVNGILIDLINKNRAQICSFCARSVSTKYREKIDIFFSNKKSIENIEHTQLVFSLSLDIFLWRCLISTLIFKENNGLSLSPFLSLSLSFVRHLDVEDKEERELLSASFSSGYIYRLE